MMLTIIVIISYIVSLLYGVYMDKRVKDLEEDAYLCGLKVASLEKKLEAKGPKVKNKDMTHE